VEIKALHGALEEFNLNEGIVITEDTEATEDIGGKKYYLCRYGNGF